MGKYSVPREILDLRPKGTMVKKQKDRYYVYEYRSTSTKVIAPDGSTRWKSKIEMGPCIGRITAEHGFISNKKSRHMDLRAQQNALDAGPILFILSKTARARETLTGFFGKDGGAALTAAAAALLVTGSLDPAELFSYYNDSCLRLFAPKAFSCVEDLHSMLVHVSDNPLLPILRQSITGMGSGRFAVIERSIPAERDGELLSVGLVCDLESDLVLWAGVSEISGRTPSRIAEKVRAYGIRDCLFMLERPPVSAVPEEFRKQGNTFAFSLAPAEAGLLSPLTNEAVDYPMGSFGFGSGKNTRQIQFLETTVHLPLENTALRMIRYLDPIKKTQDRDAFFRLNPNAVPSHEKYFGVCILCTDDLKISPADLFSACSTQWEAERFYEPFLSLPGQKPLLSVLTDSERRLLPGMGFLLQSAAIFYRDCCNAIAASGCSFQEVMQTLTAVRAVPKEDRTALEGENRDTAELCRTLDISLAEIFGNIIQNFSTT